MNYLIFDIVRSMVDFLNFSITCKKKTRRMNLIKIFTADVFGLKPVIDQFVDKNLLKILNSK